MIRQLICEKISEKEDFKQRKAYIRHLDAKIYKLELMCAKCCSEKNLQMHHITYKKPSIRYYSEWINGINKIISDRKVNSKVITLCLSCHRMIHRKIYNGIYKENKEEIPEIPI